ncbi:TetR family transcriptional regulator C-terminal domain-containing protein [Kribbella italica]|uniref:AcrR family transcriptional regulator n=1 Tax=Kribbella italica TaxID=1540520 RepID=A0A7W9MVZ0_9ACTN|nr:AcrR family transcriptional regulator [Kribbella italica]
MPRVADHAERRLAIAAAFQKLVADEGLRRTSFARVAAEAGVSVGLIQHYFANRDELLLFAYQEGLRSIFDRVEARIQAGEAAGRPISSMVLDGLAELLPLDEQRTVEYRVQQSLRSEALNDDGLAQVVQQAAAALHERVATAVENGKECGEVEAAVDAGRSAMMILATADGLAAAVALARPASTPADAVLRPVLDLVFTGRCRHFDR